MGRIRGLELLFNLEKKNLQSSEDCVVAALHCLLINENLQCVGTGDEWPEEGDEGRTSATELLPAGWNSDQNVYSLRYVSRDLKSRVLLKVTKMEHVLQVDAVLNEEDAVVGTCVPVGSHVSDDRSDYSACYKDLDSLCESFGKDIVQGLFPPPKADEPSKAQDKKCGTKGEAPLTVEPPLPSRNPDLRQERRLEQPFAYPRVGGSDLNPFGGGGGGMLMDPSSFGIPARPTLPQFGVGGPGGLPRGAVPPGARFDPFMPPIHPGGRFGPDPDHFRPPNFDDFL